MARPSQSPQSLAAMKDAIVGAARHIMLEQGLEAISIRRVAAMAGVGPSSIYYYFKNRDDILLALWESVTSITDARADALKSIDDPRVRLHRFCTGIVRFACENPAEYQLICVLEPIVALNSRTPFSKGYGLLRDTVEDVVRQRHGFKKGEFESKLSELSQAFWASIHGCIRLPMDIHSFALHEPIVLCELLTQSLLDTLDKPDTFL